MDYFKRWAYVLLPDYFQHLPMCHQWVPAPSWEPGVSVTVWIRLLEHIDSFSALNNWEVPFSFVFSLQSLVFNHKFGCFCPINPIYANVLNEIQRLGLTSSLQQTHGGWRGHLVQASAGYHSDTLLTEELCSSTCHGNHWCTWNSDYPLLLSDTCRVHKWKMNYHLQFKVKSQIDTASHSDPPWTLSKLPDAGITPKAVACDYWNPETSIYFYFLFRM